MPTLFAIIAPFIRLIRRILGLIFLFVAILGFILPIIPGWPFIVPAVLLLGRRDRSLRWLNVLVRRSLRFLRHSRTPWVRQAGIRLSTEYTRGRRALIPTIDKAERMFHWN
ncbi:MAG: hypothetical protein SH847_27595 [Roseiflexaceae bacterium]|nr:hypothetical protein [Roseiflexaceae bacterium]